MSVIQWTKVKKNEWKISVNIGKQIKRELNRFDCQYLCEVCKTINWMIHTEAAEQRQWQQ